MSRFLWGLWWSSIVVAMVFVSSTVVAAYQLVASPKELTSSPLQLVGYQRTSQNELRYIQLFNNGNQQIDLNDWRVELNVEGDNVLPQTFGYLLPGEHTIISAVDETLPGDAGVLKQSVTAKPLERIAIFPPLDTLYTTDIYTLKSTPATKDTPEIFTQSWHKTMSAKNTYSSTLTSFEVTDDILYYDPLYLPPIGSHHLQFVEVYPYSKSCSPVDLSVLCSDYVKLYNPTVDTIYLDDYVLRTDSISSNRTSSNTVHLTGYSIAPGHHLNISKTDAKANLNLTNSGGYVWLEDTWGLARYDETMTSYASAGVSQQGESWAQDDDGIWKWTSKPQPYDDNQFDIDVLGEQTTSTLGECPVGKYRNPDTNRCRTIEEAVNALAVCPEGQVRNPDTNRCRSIALANSSLVPCKEGQERNLDTNRCRSIASAVAELIPCDEGYERNPATNRCKKVVAASNGNSANLANVASIPFATTDQASVQNVLLGAIATCAVAYGLYEWRTEAARFARKLFTHWRG